MSNVTLPTVNDNGDILQYVAPQAIATALLGPAFAGWMFQIFLTGITIPLFYDCWEKSSIRIRWFVSTVFSLNLVAAGFATYTNFFWGTTQFRDSTASGVSGLTRIDCLAPLPSGLIGILVQGWFARRVAKLFKTKITRYVFVGVVGSAMILGLLGDWGMCMMFFRYKDGTVDQALPLTFANVSAVWLWSITFVDVVNTVVLGWLLYSRVAGFNKRTDSLLLKIIRLNVQTASYTATFALVSAFLISLLNENSLMQEDISFAFWLPLPALYTLGLLSTLASRDKLLEDLSKPPLTGNTSTWPGRKAPRPLSMVTVAPSDVIGSPVSPQMSEEKDKRSSNRDSRTNPTMSFFLPSPGQARKNSVDVPQDNRQWWQSPSRKSGAGNAVVLSFGSED